VAINSKEYYTIGICVADSSQIKGFERSWGRRKARTLPSAIARYQRENGKDLNAITMQVVSVVVVIDSSPSEGRVMQNVRVVESSCIDGLDGLPEADCNCGPLLALFEIEQCTARSPSFYLKLRHMRLRFMTGGWLAELCYVD